MAFKVYNCNALTGGGERALDLLSVTVLATGDRGICSVSGILSYFVYNSAGTNPENTATRPRTIRPDDYSTGGNWDESLIASEFATNAAILPFYQNTAPTGWTIQTTLDDKLLFVTKGSGAGGQTGGTVHSTGTWTISGLAADSHTHTWSGTYGTYNDNYGGGAVRYPPNTSSVTTSAPSTTGITHTPAWRPAAYCVILAKKD
jgi:hypothetical protein